LANGKIFRLSILVPKNVFDVQVSMKLKYQIFNPDKRPLWKTFWWNQDWTNYLLSQKASKHRIVKVP